MVRLTDGDRRGLTALSGAAGNDQLGTGDEGDLMVGGGPVGQMGGFAAPGKCRKRQGAGASTAPGATTAGRYCTST